MNVFFTDEATAQKPRRLIIQLLAHFLPDAAPVLRLLFHRLGFNDLFDDREVFWQAWRTGLACYRLAFFHNPGSGRRDDGLRHQFRQAQEQL